MQRAPASGSSDSDGHELPNASSRGIEAFIDCIYRSGHDLPTSAFGSWALGELQAIVPFDAACWEVCASISHGSRTLGSVGIRADFSEDMTHDLVAKPIVEQALASPGAAIDLAQIVPGSFFIDTSAQEHSRKSQIFTRILSSACFDEHSGLYSVLTLFRADRSNAFSDAERRDIQRSAYHLAQARTHATLFKALPRDCDIPHESPMALIRPHGQYEFAPLKFLELIRSHFPQSGSGALPMPIPECGSMATIHGLCIRTHSADDMACIHIWPERTFDRLTAREQGVVSAVAKGLSFRKTAERLGISTSSAANHFYRVCVKIGATSRGALLERIYRETER